MTDKLWSCILPLSFTIPPPVCSGKSVGLGGFMEINVVIHAQALLESCLLTW